VFTGSLGYPPNADGLSFFLDEVWPLVRRAVPDAAFGIVGRDPVRQLLARNKREGITVTGPVADVRPYLARAGAVVVPLRAGGGTRLKILEAMATGAGIVSTRLGAEGLDVRPGRELLIADEPAAFARATSQLLTDGALRRRLGVAARRRAEERYDWGFAADALDAVYRTAS
jgi:glycosyltransferase involved in cell wall biosynthesis